MNLARSETHNPWLVTPLGASAPPSHSGVAPRPAFGEDDGIDVEIPSAPLVPGSSADLATAVRSVPKWLLATAIARWVFVHVFAACAAVGVLMPSEGSASSETGSTLRTNIGHDGSHALHVAGSASAVAASGGCALVGEPKRVAQDAVASGGVEVGFVGDDAALAFLRNDGEAVAISLEPGSLSVKANAHTRAKANTKRAMPVDVDGALDVAIDSQPDRKLIPQGDGYLSVTKKKDALSLAVLSNSGSTVGTPVKLPRSGQLGTPTLAPVGDGALVAWAERADTSWSIQLLRWQPSQGTADAPTAVATDAISPSLVPAASDRALLVWADGPVAAHRVRAQLFDRTGAPLGATAALSPEGVNAGSPRAVVSQKGQGFVAYFVASSSAMEVWAARLSCPVAAARP